MPSFQTRLWLISDQRNDAALEHALARLPRGSGLIFRHYHLPPAHRRARFASLRRLCRAKGHLALFAGTAAQARAARADGCYGPARLITPGPATLRLATAHSLREVRQATRANALLLSPVFPTRSHPFGKTLGPVRFRLIAAQARLPVIALGGMTRQRARGLAGFGWAAIDGLAAGVKR